MKHLPRNTTDPSPHKGGSRIAIITEPTLMYGCEAWTMSKQTLKQVEVTENRGDVTNFIDGKEIT